MSVQAPMLVIDPSWRIGNESMGSKVKFWFRYENQNWLYKKARANTGEHWAEKISSEIAEFLKLPTHEVQLASYQGHSGCAVKSFLKENEVLIHGNELLAGAIPNYDKDKEQGQRDHNFDNIIRALEYRFKDDKVRGAVATIFVGYLVFDALVGNTDRHHENWGVILRRAPNIGKARVSLAPTFDHGSSLGRELLSERAQSLLASPLQLRNYIERKDISRFFRKERYAAH